MTAQALHDEVAGLFDRFVEAFRAFSGAGVVTLYFVPSVALRGDGSIQCLRARADIERTKRAGQTLASTYPVG